MDIRSYGHLLETSKSANRNLVPSPNTKKSVIVPVLTSRPKKSFDTFRICVIINVCNLRGGFDSQKNEVKG